MTDQEFQNQVAKVNNSLLGKLARRLLVENQAEIEDWLPLPMQVVVEVLERESPNLPSLVAKRRHDLLGIARAAVEGPPLRTLKYLLNLDSEETLAQQCARVAKELEGKSLEHVGGVLAEQLLWNLGRDKLSLVDCEER